MDKQKVLAKLIWDLPSFLSVLESEDLSDVAQTQKKQISELLSRLQADHHVEDAEYMIMSCPSSSPSNEPADSPGTEVPLHQDSPVWLREGVPPLPPGGPGGDDADDEDTYEEAEPYHPSNTEKPESDSSHYESYGEEDDGDESLTDSAHYIQWSASQPCLRPAPESRLCGYLWRRKWLGQWTKQLFVIRSDVLLCYKCSQDLRPHLQLSLIGCQLVYKPKSSRRIQHQLKLQLGSQSLVLGYSSLQQAEQWRRVIEEVSSAGEQTPSDQLLSCRSSSVQTDSEEEEEEEEEEEPAAGYLSRDPGVLSVLMNCQWQSLLCRVEAGLLNMFGEEEEEQEEQVEVKRSPQYTVQLRGCEVTADPAPSLRITLSMLGDQVAVLEVSSPGEKQRWLKQLQDGAAVTQQLSALSGLQTRRFPTSNPYMFDPFHLSGTVQEQPIYSNTSILEHMLHSSQDSVRFNSSSSRDSKSSHVFTNNRAVEVAQGVQKLELAGRRTVQLRAESDTNLASAGRQNKRSSFRQSLAICSERAQAGFLNPLLRRTASAKISLRRAPSSLFIEHGKVFQRRKEWETKAAA
ncbi:actin filament-associated protein 1-like 2 isoform X2 [Pseudoliparis swirei]|uniref:actin filament-associated protein 1-like 2 isoform X2 n=1 Tax=Pseudoliparis swirei TaxID=2059687 RepID=UPI0024BE4B3F|nr:actin filament-associated protein 1-like 2 isoform X2 [Pseudoliparis swirei]